MFYLSILITETIIELSVLLIEKNLFQAPEEGGEEKLALEEDENTKINMDHYYPEEYDQYAEGRFSQSIQSFSNIFQSRIALKTVLK